jgi:hypothetical protein
LLCGCVVQALFSSASDAAVCPPCVSLLWTGVCVQVAAVPGLGAPRVPPQSSVYAKTAELVETHRICYGRDTDIATYFDNYQNQGVTTSATGSQYQYKIKLGTHMMAFHLLSAGDMKDLVQQRYECM